MFVYYIFFNVLFLPILYASVITSIKSEITNKTEVPSAKAPPEPDVPSLSVEGGPLLSDIPLTTLAKVNDVGKNDEKSSIVARKGAIFPVDAVKSSEKDIEPHKNNTGLNISSEHSKTINNVTLTMNNTTTIPIVLKANNTVNNTLTESLKKTIVHKPLKTSYDELTRAKPSVPTSINQLPPPNRDSKVLVSVNSHPGMIMPVVITILLVPMFAVLGYMGLRRGQEAWKNRHYKRMDFLLDGMYND